MRPETALDGWRDWSCGLHARPVIVRPLSGGRSNRSYLLDSDQGKLALRLNGKGSLLPAGERSREVQIWQAASSHGIAPPLLFADDDSRYLVSRYIEDSVPDSPPMGGSFIDRAFDLLERCHQLKFDGPAISYTKHIERYWQLIEARNQAPRPSLLDQRGPMQTALEQLIASNTPTGLCHHDPVTANFVGNPQKLYLIDWEYAANGLLIMDYVALAAEWQLDDQTILARTGFKPHQLGQAKQIYQYLCQLWQEISDAPD